MIFRNLVFSALLAGVISGLVYGVFQQNFISPIIYSAETYEVEESAAPVPDGHAGHTHSHDGWAPHDGLERIAYTMLANVLLGIGLALPLIALMALHNLKSKKPQVSVGSGLLWGLAAMLALFVAPALLGLHPEVPGTLAAELQNRKLWWVYCALTSIAGLAILYYLPAWKKIAGFVLLALPHLTGAPLPTEHGFANATPDAVAALTALSDSFYTLTAVGMLIFFLVLGAISGFASRRFIKLDSATT